MSDPVAPRFGDAITDWWRWFAWRPVETVDRGWVWLRMVHKRRVFKHQYLGDARPNYWFQYVANLDLLR